MEFVSVCEARRAGYRRLLLRPEGQPCGTDSTVHCEGDAICVQTSPDACSDDYEGVCESRPETCPTPQPGDAVKTCFDLEFASECEARRGGYGRALLPVEP